MILLPLCVLQLAYDAGYNMADPQKPRGRVLIISNSTFYPASRLSKRYGTEVDVRKLTTIFESLNFKVDVHPNVTSEVSNILLRID